VARRDAARSRESRGKKTAVKKRETQKKRRNIASCENVRGRRSRRRRKKSRLRRTRVIKGRISRLYTRDDVATRIADARVDTSALSFPRIIDVFVALFVDHDLERDAAVASGLLILHDVFRVDRLADDLDQNARLRTIQLDEDQRTDVGSALIQVREEGHVDGAVLGIVGDVADVVFVRRVLAFALELEVILVALQLGHEFEDLVELDGEARGSVLETVFRVDAVIHDILVLRDEELAGFAVLGSVDAAARLGAIRVVLFRLSLHIGVGRVVGVEEVGHVVDVFGVSRGVRFLELDEGLGFIGTRAESHARVGWHHRVVSRQQRSLIVGEGVKKDGEETGEEAGETGVVDQVEKADLAPRRGRPGEDGTRLAVVDEVARTHGEGRACRGSFYKDGEMCFFLGLKKALKRFFCGLLFPRLA